MLDTLDAHTRRLSSTAARDAVCLGAVAHIHQDLADAALRRTAPLAAAIMPNPVHPAPTRLRATN